MITNPIILAMIVSLGPIPQNDSQHKSGLKLILAPSAELEQDIEKDELYDNLGNPTNRLLSWFYRIINLVCEVYVIYFDKYTTDRKPDTKTFVPSIVTLQIDKKESIVTILIRWTSDLKVPIADIRVLIGMSIQNDNYSLDKDFQTGFLYATNFNVHKPISLFDNSQNSSVPVLSVNNTGIVKNCDTFKELRVVERKNEPNPEMPTGILERFKKSRKQRENKPKEENVEENTSENTCEDTNAVLENNESDVKSIPDNSKKAKFNRPNKKNLNEGGDD